ncbi:hypothetical protein JAAARDRAFT_27724 [Jaapia argillacea MUCL 33604]|uniref:Glycoside hydrolase family 71 protein n=1 Tax=Jaapia argillacea MUCL 33604 TaxID=933084 RepID=A0A067QAL0_9AGAM|nr:hypothetical protein JAAARDRAFT_27724 [Jaapia argillacea MUCL 33604]
MRLCYFPFVAALWFLSETSTVAGHGVGRKHAELTAKMSKRQTTTWLKWCGKNYQVGSPVDTSLVDPGRMTVPQTSSAPLLDFRCTPTIQPYLNSDTSGSFIIDANITHDVGQSFNSAIPTSSLNSSSLSITISLSSSSSPLTTFTVPVGSTAFESPSVDLSSFPASTTGYNVTCVATLSVSNQKQTFQATTSVKRLPANPYGGSTTKIDRRTGGLLRESASGAWEPLIPFGFYTYVEDIVANMSLLTDMKNDGWNVVHLSPPYPDAASLTTVLDAADAAGITYVADFRDIYTNITAMTPLIQLFRARKGLLTWYSADEPDGTHDPVAGITAAYDLIYQQDGYHPIALVLNCADFFWADYTSGADILFSDAYPIGCNTTFSKSYHTPCNATYGCCGCDNCEGDLADISNRFDSWSERRRWIGRTRDLPMWNVAQAFDGTSEQWTLPTGAEFKLQTVLGANHGAVGIMPWSNPYPIPTLAQATREIAPIFAQTLAPIIVNHTANWAALKANASGVDVASWSVMTSTNTAQTLIMFANTQYSNVVAAVVPSFDLTAKGISVQTLFGNGAVAEGQLVVPMDSTGVAGFLVQHAATPGDASGGGSGGSGSTGSSGGKKSAGGKLAPILANPWAVGLAMVAVGAGALVVN